MGLFDFFRRPPTPDKFATMFVKELRRSGAAGPIEYDAEYDRILVGTGGDRQIINLGNFFKEYLALPWSKRREHLADRARLMLSQGEEFASEFAEARGHLRPKLWVRAALTKMRLQIQVDGGDPDKFEIPEYAVGTHLVASLAYDLPQAMHSVTAEELQGWGASYYEALEIARENLGQAPFTYAEIGSGCYAFSTGDSYDSSRLLLPPLLANLKVSGDLIAMVPNRDSLLVTGSDDPAGLLIMANLAEAALKDSRPMVPIALRLEDGDWVDWMPPPGHPAEGKFRELALRFFLDEYADQKHLLERLLQMDGIDQFVASYAVVKKTDGNLHSYAVWSEGVITLLPRAEWVRFFRDEDDLPAAAPWEKVEHVVGHLMKPTRHYPPRVLVGDFPTDAELEAIGTGEP